MTRINRHKYSAEQVVRDGVVWPSKKEFRYYQSLLMRMNPGGDIKFVLRQVPFHLPGNVVYRVDFQEFHKNGTIHFVDVKGRRTKEFIMKKKMVESLYPVTIEEA